MKKIIYSTALLICFSNCGRFREQTNINFDVTYHKIVNVPDSSAIIGSYVDCPVVSVATRSKEYFEQYHAEAKKLKKVHMLLFRVEKADTFQKNFDFLDSIHVYASTSDLPEQLIARKSIIPKNQWRLNLIEAPNVQLKEYFLQDTIYLRTVLFINKLPEPEAKIDLIPTMYVEGKSVL